MPDKLRYFVVHTGTGTILDLEECKIVVVNEATNPDAMNAMYDDDSYSLLKLANEKYSGKDDVTLG